MKIIKILLLLLILTSSCVKKKPVVTYTTHPYSFNESEIALMQITNDYRKAIKKDTLTLVPIEQIGYLSEEHNNYMIEKDTLSHDYFTYRADNLKSTTGAERVGEVIAYNYITNESVLRAWLNSPGHKKVIEGDFTNFGVSIRPDKKGRKYYTFIFIKK